jgi:two-component system, NarL family, nitrate/nitrite sensor histidine kinase NarQ
MSYSFIKWSILLSPAFMLGIWEYIRHEFLLSIISMETGNWLSPIIVGLSILIFSTPLFRKLEKIQAELNKERAYKAKIEERQKISQELHDGISQSLFLLSVKVNKLERSMKEEQLNEVYKIKQTVQHIYDDVRHSIQNLRIPPLDIDHFSLFQSLNMLLNEIREETDIEVHLYWDFLEKTLSPKEQIELFSIIKEALMNVRKHSKCTNLYITAEQKNDYLSCVIRDDGIGYKENHDSGSHHGIEIMKDRAKRMNWNFTIENCNEGTVLSIVKEGENSD